MRLDIPVTGIVNLCHFCEEILPPFCGYTVNGKFVYVCDRCECLFDEAVTTGTLFAPVVPGPVRDNGGYHLNVQRRAVR